MASGSTERSRADQAAASVPPIPEARDTAPAVQKPPVLTRAPETGRKFPCKACGARLDFDPSLRALKCPYCGHVEEIAPSDVKVRELDYETYLHKQAGEQTPIPGRSSEVRCPGCGANVLLEDNVATDRCPFCATALSNATPQTAQNQIHPQSCLPFAVTQRQAVERFNAWIASRWFAPGDLRQLANLGQLSGVYLPFWTYDSMTYTHYTGARGDDYWDTETYHDRDANGHMVTRTRQVRRTRWTRVSGEVDHFFDDVLVCASRSLPEPYVDRLEPWDLEDLEGFQPEFLSGFKTERYTVTLGEGFAAATEIMDAQIRLLCNRDIGGDHQRLDSVETQHVGVTFKHLLLPIWLAVYRYHDKTYRIMVNARTGEVVGSRPYSAAKIAALVLAILIAVLAIGWVAANAQ